MSKPDPKQVPRQPMARAQSQIAWTTSGRDPITDRALFCDQALNLDTVHHLLETAEVISEGRIDPIASGDRFFGSTIISVDLRNAQVVEPINELIAAELTVAIERDPRAKRAIEGRVFREIARLMGAQTSTHFETQTSIVRSGVTLRIRSDFESDVERGKASAR
jgi:hypothetical protein